MLAQNRSQQAQRDGRGLFLPHCGCFFVGRSPPGGVSPLGFADFWRSLQKNRKNPLTNRGNGATMSVESVGGIRAESLL